MSHLGEVVLMLALGVTFAQLGEIGRRDETAASRMREGREEDREPRPRWWIAALAAGGALLSGLGIHHALALAAAVAVATLLISPDDP